jgi:hypothetical protein
VQKKAAERLRELEHPAIDAIAHILDSFTRPRLVLRICPLQLHLPISELANNLFETRHVSHRYRHLALQTECLIALYLAKTP